jgi:hypothetical protein
MIGRLLCRMGYTTMYLSTKDKQHFYRHLGYSDCDAVTTLGSNANRINTEQVPAASAITATNRPTTTTTND